MPGQPPTPTDARVGRWGARDLIRAGHGGTIAMVCGGWEDEGTGDWRCERGAWRCPLSGGLANPEVTNDHYYKQALHRSNRSN